MVIFRVRGDKQLPPQYVPMREREDRRLYLLEVSYTALGGMERRRKEKLHDRYRCPHADVSTSVPVVTLAAYYDGADGITATYFPLIRLRRSIVVA